MLNLPRDLGIFAFCILRSSSSYLSHGKALFMIEYMLDRWPSSNHDFCDAGFFLSMREKFDNPSWLRDLGQTFVGKWSFKFQVFGTRLQWFLQAKILRCEFWSFDKSIQNAWPLNLLRLYFGHFLWILRIEDYRKLRGPFTWIVSKKIFKNAGMRTDLDGLVSVFFLPGSTQAWVFLNSLWKLDCLPFLIVRFVGV